MWDVIVVGGGAAGLSAALVLGRARKKTLVIDAGEPSNLAAHGIGGMLGFDGRPPAELYATGREELAKYPSVEVRSGTVATASAADGHFHVGDEAARRVLLAGGMDYKYKSLPGAEGRWGRSVFHCPFCHGWEVQDRALGVLDSEPSGLHRALLLRSWSDDVTLLTDGPAALPADDLARLRAAGVAIDERPVADVHGPGDEVEELSFADGSTRPLGGLLVAVTMHQRSSLHTQLGVATVEDHPMMVDAIKTETMAATSVPGVFAAGDIAAQMPSVANSISGGSVAAAHVVQSLLP